MLLSPTPTRDAKVRRLFRGRSGVPFEEFAGLLRPSVAVRPSDFQFLDASDIRDRASSVFARIPEWDAFAEHLATCKRCVAL
jgi:hypothetical protein